MAGLTASQVKAAKPGKKQYKLFDERGLHFLVHPNGGKYWHFRYRFDGKREELAPGTYPEISLADARDLREDHRRAVARGIDPAVERKARKQSRRAEVRNTFETVAREWLATRAWTDSTRDLVTRRLQKDLFPYLGDEPIAHIDPPRLLTVLRKAEARGVGYTAHCLRQHAGQIFRYAIATGRASRDPAADLKGALMPKKTNHFAAITDPKDIGPLLRAIDEYHGTRSSDLRYG
ncbi:MAG TPA: integrase arm-type DNA-binding domain-containing protein [Gammaproteobacteria bacterium]|nr:integrase arm-type DNA-binding domain-containing protein [Gammaproteobacteria bacterium]